MPEESRIYLDHAATTPTDQRVLEEMLPYFSSCFGNASSLHREGRRAVAAVDSARERVARAIGASPNEIYFTSGGTESDNWAIEGIAAANPDKRHIIASAIEHHAVLSPLKRLEARGYEVTYLSVDEYGFVSPEEAAKAIRSDTLLVTVMLANNEVGSIQPLKGIVRDAHRVGALVHTDAVQAVGSIHVDVNDLGVDLLSLSAHKFYGPKGVGALYLRKGTKIKGFHLGGEQERSLRGGTYNTPAIVGLGRAIEIAVSDLQVNADHIAALKAHFLERVLSEVDFTHRNGGEPSLPGVTNLCFYGVKNSDLLSALDMMGVAASSGSACSSGSVEPSHVLSAMGLDKSEVTASLRFSFGKENTLEEADRAVDVLKGIVTRLRKDTDLFLTEKAKKYEL